MSLMVISSPTAPYRTIMTYLNEILKIVHGRRRVWRAVDFTLSSCTYTASATSRSPSTSTVVCASVTSS